MKAIRVILAALYISMAVFGLTIMDKAHEVGGHDSCPFTRNLDRCLGEDGPLAWINSHFEILDNFTVAVNSDANNLVDILLYLSFAILGWFIYQKKSDLYKRYFDKKPNSPPKNEVRFLNWLAIIKREALAS